MSKKRYAEQFAKLGVDELPIKNLNKLDEISNIMKDSDGLLVKKAQK